MNTGSAKQGLEKKVVSRNVVLALSVICILAVAALIGVYASYTATINSKDNAISSLNSQITSLEQQVTKVTTYTTTSATTSTSTTSTTTLNSTEQKIASSLETAFPSMNLTIIGASGKKVVLNPAEIAMLPTQSGMGGVSGPGGSFIDYGNYTGIPILTLLNLVGGVTSSQTVISVDNNYNVTMTYAQVTCTGGIAYYYANGTATTPTKPTTMIVAFYYNGATLPSNYGPLRIAIVGPQGLYTSGPLWNYQLWEIDVP